MFNITAVCVEVNTFGMLVYVLGFPKFDPPPSRGPSNLSPKGHLSKRGDTWRLLYLCVMLPRPNCASSYSAVVIFSQACSSSITHPFHRPTHAPSNHSEIWMANGAIIFPVITKGFPRSLVGAIRCNETDATLTTHIIPFTECSISFGL